MAHQLQLYLLWSVLRGSSINWRVSEGDTEWRQLKGQWVWMRRSYFPVGVTERTTSLDRNAVSYNLEETFEYKPCNGLSDGETINIHVARGCSEVEDSFLREFR